MPGWWFTVESTTTKHLIHQFKAAIEDALGSSTKVRAEMRARSAKQRFPVAKWVEDLEILQSSSIRIHQSEPRSNKPFSRRSGVPEAKFEMLSSRSRNVSTDRLSMYEESAPESGPPSRDETGQANGLGRSLSLGKRAGPGHRLLTEHANRLSRVGEIGEEDGEVEISPEDAQDAFRNNEVSEALRRLEGLDSAMPRALQAGPRGRDDSDSRGRGRARSRTPRISISDADGIETRPTSLALGDDRSRSPSPMARTSLLPHDPRPSMYRHSSASLLSLSGVTLGRHDYNLQKVELNFTDSNGEYYKKFEAMLQQKLNAKSSESTLVIEDYLKESEKEWAAKYRAAKLGRTRSPSPANPHQRYSSPAGSLNGSRRNSSSSEDGTVYAGSVMDEFLLGENYVRPSILKRWLQTRILDWPIYSIFLAIGQIIAANSYQIVLLTGGSSGNEAEKLYIIGGIYIIASGLWWTMFRTMRPRWVMSVPFAFYGLAFLLVGLAPLIPSGGGRDWARNVATGLYATASASGSLYFALNFGDEGKSKEHLFLLSLANLYRRRSNKVLGVPRLPRPRHPANLRRGALLLGQRHGRSDRLRPNSAISNN